jgi:excisionase family DNA binding protein
MTVTQTIWTPTSGTPTRIPMRAAPSRRLAASAAPPASETLLTIKDVADACQLSETAVRRAVHDGQLQSVKLRSRVRITRQDFDKWILGQRQPSTARRAVAANQARPRRRPATGSFRALAHADLDRELQR